VPNEITLDQLLGKWGETWNIYQTPKGVFVATRKRHFILSPTKIDQGFRDCIIEETGKKMDNQIAKQEEISSALQTNGA